MKLFGIPDPTYRGLSLLDAIRELSCSQFGAVVNVCRCYDGVVATTRAGDENNSNPFARLTMSELRWMLTDAADCLIPRKSPLPLATVPVELGSTYWPVLALSELLLARQGFVHIDQLMLMVDGLGLLNAVLATLVEVSKTWDLQPVDVVIGTREVTVASHALMHGYPAVWFLPDDRNTPRPKPTVYPISDDTAKVIHEMAPARCAVVFRLGDLTVEAYDSVWRLFRACRRHNRAVWVEAIHVGGEDRIGTSPRRRYDPSTVEMIQGWQPDAYICNSPMDFRLSELNLRLSEVYLTDTR